MISVRSRFRRSARRKNKARLNPATRTGISRPGPRSAPLPRPSTRKGKLPAVAVGVEDVDGITDAVSVLADLLDLGAALLQCPVSPVFLLPGNIERMMRIDGARPLRSVEEMHFKIAEPNVHLPDLARGDLFGRGSDSAHHLSTECL